MNPTRLDAIAAILEGLEETIIARLIDRAQFHANTVVYQQGGSGFVTGDTETDRRSLLELRVRFQEEMDSQFGRFHVPEERPFTKDLPPSRRRVNLPANPLRITDFDCVNLTGEIMARYQQLVVDICQPGDDGQYGSSVELDVSALQAISRRVHFGSLYVAEVKYRDQPQVFDRLIDSGDEDGLAALLTRAEVEQRILGRVREKASVAQSTVNPAVRHTIDSDVVGRFYSQTIIPLTKRGEILYLLNRDRE